MNSSNNPYENIKQIFHEPNRLAIMSSLCAAETEGMTFNELKKECSLTDGNLSRHLNTLKNINVIKVKKSLSEQNHARQYLSQKRATKGSMNI